MLVYFAVLIKTNHLVCHNGFTSQALRMRLYSYKNSKFFSFSLFFCCSHIGTSHWFSFFWGKFSVYVARSFLAWSLSRLTSQLNRCLKIVFWKFFLNWLYILIVIKTKVKFDLSTPLCDSYQKKTPYFLPIYIICSNEH